MPRPEDRLFFLLTSVKTSSLQVVQGGLFGMPQCQAHQWIHVLLPVRLAALRPLGAPPSRSLAALAERRGVSATDAAVVITPLAEDPVPVAATAAATPATAPAATAPASPLGPMTGRNGASSAPKTLLNRRTVRAARNRTTPSTTSCASMPH